MSVCGNRQRYKAVFPKYATGSEETERSVRSQIKRLVMLSFKNAKSESSNVPETAMEFISSAWYPVFAISSARVPGVMTLTETAIGAWMSVHSTIRLSMPIRKLPTSYHRLNFAQSLPLYLSFVPGGTTAVHILVSDIKLFSLSSNWGGVSALKKAILTLKHGRYPIDCMVDGKVTLASLR